jgi:hypothetical protein
MNRWLQIGVSRSARPPKSRYRGQRVRSLACAIRRYVRSPRRTRNDPQNRPQGVPRARGEAPSRGDRGRFGPGALRTAGAPVAAACHG